MMNASLLYGDRHIPYNIVTSPTLTKKIRIHVHPNSRVEVEAPENHPLNEISLAVCKRARWIFKQLQMTEEVRKHACIREYVSGETHFYIGRRYPLKIIETREEYATVELRSGRIEVITRSADPASVRRRLNAWYKEKSFAYFQKRIAHLAEHISWIEVVPPIKLITMTKQWGSCSPEGVIHLNPWLIRAPVDCIDYVIMHELCHLRERNHSKKYYELLGRHYPNWQHIKAKLDGMSELLLSE